MSKTSEVETVQQGTVSDATHETELPVETSVENAAEMPLEVSDSFGHTEGLSKTSEAETLSSTAVSEKPPEVLDTASEIYRTPCSTQDYGDWEDTDWG
jgi:hypothetical protein